MKTLTCLKPLLLIIVFASLTIFASPVTKTADHKTYSADGNPIYISNANMDVIGANDGMFINHSNPGMENLVFTVSDEFGNVLEVSQASDPAGQIYYSADDLINAGGDGTYQISLYSNTNPPLKKLKTVLIVIIPE